MSGTSIHRLLCLVLLSLAALCGALGWHLILGPSLKYRQLVNKYPPGTDASTIIADYGGKLSLRRTGNTLPFEPREDEKKTYVFYYLLLPDSRAEIEFNYYQEVVRILKFSELRQSQ